MRKQMLLKNAVPNQNLPAASHSRRKNTVQNESPAQRLLNRKAKQSKGDAGVMVETSIDLKKQVNAKENANNSNLVNSKRTTYPVISISKKSAERSVKDSSVDNACINLNVMDLLKTRNKLNAWTGIQSFSLLRKIEERVSAMHPKIVEANELSLLEGILLCFIRLKTKLPFICWTSIFHLSTSAASKIFNFMLPLITIALDDVDYFSSTIESNDNQLIPLRMYGYNEAREILDCSEGDVKNSKCNHLQLYRHLIELIFYFVIAGNKPIRTDLCSPMLEDRPAAESSPVTAYSFSTL